MSHNPVVAAPFPGPTSAPIPVADPARALARIRPAVEAAIAAVLDSGRLVLGPQVEAFEDEFAAWCASAPPDVTRPATGTTGATGATGPVVRPVLHAVGVGNGTDALELALRSLELPAGAEVVLAANAGFYAASACLAVGARPVFADIDPHTHGLDPDAVAAVVGPRTAAIVVTHLYGQLARVEELVTLARRAGLAVVEDGAQAHGAGRAGQRVGTFGDVAAFSFYPTKNLPALGDGGAVVTADPARAARLRSLRQHGWTQRYAVTVAGGRNSRLDEVQAAVLRVALPCVDTWNAERRAVATAYRQAAGTRAAVVGSDGPDFVGHLAVVVAGPGRRTSLAAALAADGVATAVHYPVCDHRQSVLAGQAAAQAVLPRSEAMAEQVLTLPCFVGIRDDEVARVVTALDRALDRALDAAPPSGGGGGA